MIKQNLDTDEQINQFKAGICATEIANKFNAVVRRMTRKDHERKKPKRICENIRRELRRSIRALAKDKGVSKTTTWTMVRKDLGMKAYKKQCQQLLSQARKAKHFVRGKKILQHLLRDMHLPILWTDEKVFNIQAIHHVQNDRVYGRFKENLGVEVLSTCCQGPASVMVWGGVMSDGGKTPSPSSRRA